MTCFAAVLGLVIILLCMLLLFIAETERCCQHDSLEAESGHRLLASESSNSYYQDDPPLEDTGCCPEFGSRRYGGLGEIEPYVSHHFVSDAIPLCIVHYCGVWKR